MAPPSGATLAQPVAAVAVERSWGRLGRAAVAQMQGTRSSHEDSHVLAQELGMCGVYDGHCGEEAAAFAAARLHRHVAAAGSPQPDKLQAAFVACDQEMQGKLPRSSEAGTTATLAVVQEEGADCLRVWVANCGDSRAVLWHQDTDVIEESADHRPSDPAERARIESAGGYVFDDFEPARVDGELACSRALGDYRYKRNPDLPPGNQKVSSVPDVYEWRARRGDWLILACDGIWNTFSSGQVVDRLCKRSMEAEMGSKLAMFLNFCIEKNADDNLTLSAVQLGSADTRLPPVLSVMPFGFLAVTDKEVLEQYRAFCRRFGRAVERKTKMVRDVPKSVAAMAAVEPTRGAAAFALHLAPPPPPQRAVRTPLQVPLDAAQACRVITREGTDLEAAIGQGSALEPTPSPAGGGLFACCTGRQPAKSAQPEPLDVGQPPAAAAVTGAAAALLQQVRHGAALPSELANKIPKEDQQILSFLLALLESQSEGRSLPLFINGGYVRDLLLGKTPDDLDLCVCLRDCAPDVNVGTLLEKAPGFAKSRKQLGVKEVKLATCLSEESKEKKLDAFKAHFSISGSSIEVDVMPTIGEEVYDGDSRIPTRDERGTPEQDSLRRDLTIGALLLQVSPDGSSGLRYDLFDYYGGLEDLRRGVLRSPYPRGMRLSAVKAQVLRSAGSSYDKELARSLGLDRLPEAEAVQALWWAKVLMDDPLRIVRALRFAAKFRFRLHDSFWQALPFALQLLRSKVAGERKFTEYTKIAGYGFEPSTCFFEDAFSRVFGPPRAPVRSAPALFGGLDEKKQVRGLSEVTSFDEALYRDLAGSLREVREPSELLGGLLACSCFAAGFGGGGRGVAEEFTEACGGIGATKAAREAGSYLFASLQALECEPPSCDRLDAGFAAAAGMPQEAFVMHLHAWKALHASKSATEDVMAARRALVLKMLRKNSPARFTEVDRCMVALNFARPAVKGGVLDTQGILFVPGPLRTRVMALLEVTLRILKVSDPLESGEQLRTLFGARPALGSALDSSVWFLEDGKTLRDEFNPKKDASSKKAKASKKS